MFKFNLLKYRLFTILTLIGILISFLIESSIFIVNINNFFSSDYSVLVIFLPILLGIWGFILDKKNFKKYKKTNYLKLKWSYISIIIGAIFPILLGLLNVIFNDDIINRTFLYIPNLLTGRSFGDLYTNNLLMGLFFIIILYPLLLISIGILIDFLILKNKK